MPYSKSDISKDIAFKASISHKTSKDILDKFIELIVLASFKKKVKISNFGTFERYLTPSRIGRNPKTGEEFEIIQRSKLRLITSNILKDKIN